MSVFFYIQFLSSLRNLTDLIDDYKPYSKGTILPQIQDNSADGHPAHITMWFYLKEELSNSRLH